MSSSQRETLSLDIAIVGGGLGGLAAAYCLGKAGHSVTVFESASAIGDVGAGIQIVPNLTRLLVRWGLGKRLEEIGVVPNAATLRRYNTGERIAWTELGTTIEDEHGALYYQIHRADFYDMLLSIAAPFMNLRLNSRVVSLDPSVPTLTLASGEVVKADVMIGADGINSTVREIVIGRPYPPVPTGDAAYRAIIPADELLKDDDLKELVDFPEMTGWVGPNRHIMAYCIRGRKEYNVVMCHPDVNTAESRPGEAALDKMRAEFAGWEPRVQKLLALIPTALSWKLMDHAPLDTWVHKDGKVALLGDACHPMLPYRAQGSAMAVEDAAVLGNLFSRLRCRSQITPLLHAYQHLRHARTAELQASSRLNQRIFHLSDGPEQKARDDSMRAGMASVYGGSNDGAKAPENIGNANQLADKAKNIVHFSYDADAEVEKWWSEGGLG